MMEASAIKKVVAMGIGAAVYIVLSRFVAIPTPIPNTTLQVTIVKICGYFRNNFNICIFKNNNKQRKLKRGII